VAREILDDAHFVKHNDLGYESDGLEPHGETPCKCPGFPSRVQYTGRYQSNWNKNLKMGELISK